ncbi:MAG: DUF1549 domain-containing protein [Isosphaeraceae bacterium]
MGLPPSRDDLAAFRAETRPDAAPRVVDRLLADPRHGERWGRHWLDVWRYSDWYGLGAEIRYSHPHIWRWRDWVVSSLNADAGYDRMVTAMLAGDELAPGDPDTLRATGFLVRNWEIFNRNVWLSNTVEHTARAFLGLTLQCARCHDHKFDPVSQVEYYRLRAFFEPYHVRIDRVPAEPDRTKAGLARAFDDYLDRATYRFIRGDEARPDTTRPLLPGTPAVLGGEVRIVPRTLTLEEAWPDKRPFVIRETVAAAESAVVQARSAKTAAEQRRTESDRALRAAEEADRQALNALGTAKADQVPAARNRSTAAAEVLARARAAAREATEEAHTAGTALAGAGEADTSPRSGSRTMWTRGKTDRPMVRPWPRGGMPHSDVPPGDGPARAGDGLRRDTDHFSRILDALVQPAATGLKEIRSRGSDRGRQRAGSGGCARGG